MVSTSPSTCAPCGMAARAVCAPQAWRQLRTPALSEASPNFDHHGPFVHGDALSLSSPWQKAPLHSTGDASRLTALFLGRIWPICSLVTPCQPGASPVSVRRGVSPRAVRSPWQKAPLHSTGDASRLTALFLGRAGAASATRPAAGATDADMIRTNVSSASANGPVLRLTPTSVYLSPEDLLHPPVVSVNVSADSVPSSCASNSSGLTVLKLLNT